MQLPTAPRSVNMKYPEYKTLRNVPPEPEELRSVIDTFEPQQEVSVARHLKNWLYINSGALEHILFNQELLGGFIQLDQVIKIQDDDKSICLLQIRPLHKALRYLLLPVNKYHHNENAIANLLSFTKLVGKCYITFNTRINDIIYETGQPKPRSGGITDHFCKMSFFRSFISP